VFPDCERTASEAAAGCVLGGRYVVRERIGRGATAFVHRATDLHTARDVSVKTPRPELRSDRREIAAIRREASIARRLQHPHLATCLDDGEFDGVPFIVCELLDGASLRAYTGAGHVLAAEQVAELLAGVASALAYMHAAGVVHADVKPGNLMFARCGVIKLIDLGSTHCLTAPGDYPRSATPTYAAPEILYGAPPDPRDDVYSLCVLAYQLLMGRHPYHGDAPITGLEPSDPVCLSAAGWRWLRAGLSASRAGRPSDPRELVPAMRQSSRSASWLL